MVEISNRSFEDNFRFLATLAGTQVDLLAIVKANAYGHSLEFCAAAAVRARVRRAYREAMTEALIVLSEASDRICGTSSFLLFSSSYRNYARIENTPLVQ